MRVPLTTAVRRQVANRLPAIVQRVFDAADHGEEWAIKLIWQAFVPKMRLPLHTAGVQVDKEDADALAEDAKDMTSPRGW